MSTSNTRQGGTRMTVRLRLVTTLLVSATSFTLIAQTPAPVPQVASPAAQVQTGGRGDATQAPGAPAGAPVPGRGGRGGLGGPGRDDPANAGVDYSPKPPIKPLRPEEELKHFQLQTGYRVELVLAEPHIAEPGAVTFDGNGRMYVTELRSYMNDADGTDTLTPTGRISRHEDVDNDGVYERHTVFVDKLTFPRFAMPIGADAILTKSSNDPDVWKYTDTNGDGVADKRELFATDFGRGGNVEHQESHLTWAMDNWLYSTYNAVRLRWTPHGVLREPHRIARWRLGSDAGQRRQDLDSRRRERAARLLSAAARVRQLRHPRHDGSGPQDHVGCAGSDRGHAAWHALGPHARRIAAHVDGRCRRRHLPRPPSAAGSGRRLFLRGSRRAHRPTDQTGSARRHHVSHQLLPELRVHPAHGSALPFSRSGDSSGRHDVPRRHVPRHHPGVPMDSARHLPARKDRAVSARQGHRPRKDLAAQVRRDGARSNATAHAQRNAGATCPAPGASERVVARHRTTTSRTQARQIGRPGAPTDRPLVTESRRTFPRAVDDRGIGRPRSSARPTGDERSAAADAHPSDSRQRNALQRRRSDILERLSPADQGFERGRRHPGHAHLQRPQARRHHKGRRRGARGQSRRAASRSSVNKC